MPMRSTANTLGVTNYGASFLGEIELCFPDGWNIDQAIQKVNLAQREYAIPRIYGETFKKC